MLLVRSRILTQLLTAIEDKNVDRFCIALPIALAQTPPIDLNLILQNGQTILTFAALHFNPSIIVKLVREPLVNVWQVNAFGQTPAQIVSQLGIPDETCRYLFKTADDSIPSPGRLIAIQQNCQNFATHNHNNKRDQALKHKCTLCNTTLSTASSLLIHQRVHTGDRPFKCNECGVTFKQTSHLTRHKRIHTGDRPYKCDMCKRAFTQSSALVIHKRSHTGHRPFACEECGKQFSTSTHLARHRKVHTGERPFKCDQCNKQFSQRENLTRHQLVHATARPHKCEICGKTFKDQSYFNRHTRSHPSGTGSHDVKLSLKKTKKTLRRNFGKA